MAKTTSNQSRAIVHRWSDHTAVSDGKSDECVKLDLTPDTWDNSAYSILLTNKRSSNTFIQNGAICKEDTWIGPLSFPLHPGILGGTESGTFWRESTSTSCSENCFVEGKGVVRTDDTTDQNCGNTTGAINEGFIQPSLESGNEEAERICQIADIKGVSTFSGRALGYWGKAEGELPNHLDVYTPATVKFDTVRKDITDPNAQENPACPKGGKHTSWLASWTVFPLYIGTAQTKADNGEHFEVNASDAVSEWLVALGGFKAGTEPTFDAGDGQGGGAQDYGQEWGGDRDGDWIKASKQRVGGPTSLSKEPVGKTLGKKASIDLKASPENIKRLLLWFWWYWNAPEIKVTATACAGAREATIRVLPYQKLKLDFDLNIPIKQAAGALARRVNNRVQGGRDNAQNASDKISNKADRGVGRIEKSIAGVDRAQSKIHSNDGQNQSHFDNKRKKLQERIDKLRAQEKKETAQFDRSVRYFDMVLTTFKRIKEVISFFQKIQSMVKGGAEFKIEFLESFGMEITTSYQPCGDRESFFGLGYRSNAQLGLLWEFRLEAEPLLGVHGRVYVSLLSFIPGIGAAAGFLRKYIRVDVFVSGAFGVSANVGIDKDPDDYFSLTAPELSFDMNISAGLIAGIAFLEIQGDIRAPSKVTFKFVEPKKEGSMLEMSVTGKVNVFATVTANPDSYWAVELYSREIKSLRYGEKEFGPFVLLRQPS